MAFQLRSGKKPVFKKLGSKTPLNKRGCKSPFSSDLLKSMKDERKGEGYKKSQSSNIVNALKEF